MDSVMGIEGEMDSSYLEGEKGEDCREGFHSNSGVNH